MRYDTLSGSIYLATVGVAIADRLIPFPASREIGVALTVAFLALEFHRTPPLQRWVGLALAALGVGTAWAGGNLWASLFDCLYRSQIFLVMFFAVSWLRDPAVTSPSLRDLRDAVVRQPPGRRYPILWLSAHFLGAVLNLAAMSLLVSMASDQREPRLRRRLSIALMHGFTVASAWGPFYVSVAVILTAVPGVKWSEIAPWGILMSMGLLAVGWSYDRLVLREPTPKRVGPPEHPLRAAVLGRVALLLVQLISLVALLHEAAGLSIPISLGIVAPPFALAWAAVQAAPGRRVRDGAQALAGRIFRALPQLRNEAVAFVAASLCGVGVAQVVPPERIGAWLDAAGLGPEAVILGLIAAMIGFGIAGLHPVIVVFMVGEVVRPDTVGLAPQTMALAMLGVWGLSTMGSPFSATTLFMSRVLAVPSHILGWRWNLPLLLLSAVAVAVYVLVLHRQVF